MVQVLPSPPVARRGARPLGRYGQAYCEAWSQSGKPTEAADIAVAVHGFVAEDSQDASDTYLRHEMMFRTGSAEIGRPGMAPPNRLADMRPGGTVFAGSPDEIADRILHLHERLGHSRQIL